MNNNQIELLTVILGFMAAVTPVMQGIIRAIWKFSTAGRNRSKKMIMWNSLVPRVLCVRG